MFAKIHSIPLPFVTIDVYEETSNDKVDIQDLPQFALPVRVNGRGVIVSNEIYLNFENVTYLNSQHEKSVFYHRDGWAVDKDSEVFKQIEEAKRYLVDSLRFSIELGALSKMNLNGLQIENKFVFLNEAAVNQLWKTIYPLDSTGSKMIFDPDVEEPPRILLDAGNGVWCQATKMREVKRKTHRIYGKTEIFNEEYLVSFWRDTNPTLFKDHVEKQSLQDAYFAGMTKLEERMGVQIPWHADVIFDEDNK